MSRAIVVDDGSDAVVKTLWGNPEQFALQVRSGQSLFALTDGDDGRMINDAEVVVSSSGELAWRAGCTETGSPPDIQLEYIAI